MTVLGLMALGSHHIEGHDHCMLRSRVLTFHVEATHVRQVVDALDRVRERLEKNPDFRGLVCLEGQGKRHQVMVLTLWDGDGLDEMRDEDEQARLQIAETCDLGVRSEEYDVLRHFTGGTVSTRITPYRVVLIDSDDDERSLLRTRMEESCRFLVIGEADNGPAGTAIAARLHPDLIALDTSLPGGDAMGTLRTIQAACPATKIVVVSGLVSADLVHAMVDILGASSCLDKNIGVDRLVNECLNALEQPNQPYNTSDRAELDRACVLDRHLSVVVRATSSNSVAISCSRPTRSAVFSVVAG